MAINVCPVTVSPDLLPPVIVISTQRYCIDGRDVNPATAFARPVKITDQIKIIGIVGLKDFP